MDGSLYELRRKPHTSISAVKEYVMCPRRYFLHYVKGVMPSHKAAASAFGSAWHATIGKWLLDEAIGSDELESYFRDDLISRLRAERVPVLFDDEDDSEGKLLDSGLKMLRIFFTRVRRPEVVLGVEVAFSIELAHPMTGEVLPVPLVGSIDALVVEDAQKYLWELKTAARKWSADQVEFDTQVSAYKIAARHLGQGDAVLRLLVTTKTVHPDVQIEDPVRHTADVREVMDVIFGVHQAVASGVDYPNRGWQCRTCAYAEPCRG